MKRFNEQYTMFYYYYLNKNILLLDDLEKYLDDFKNMIANYDYLSVVDMFLEESLNNNFLPHKMYEKIEVILKFIKSVLDEKNENYEQTMEMYNNCLSKLEQVKNNDSMDFYNYEFLRRIDNIYEYATNNAYVWKKADLETSIRFDYTLLLILTIEEDDYKKLLPSILLNHNVIFSLRALLLDFPELFRYKRAKKRAFEILNLNIDYIDNKEEACDIYKENNQIKESVNKKSLLRLKEDSENLKYRIDKVKDQVYLPTISFYYNELKLQNILTLEKSKFNTEKEKYIENYMNLEYLFEFIESGNSLIKYSSKVKENIIDLMAAFKEKYGLKKELLERYNECLLKINGTQFNYKDFYVEQLLKTENLIKVFFDAIRIYITKVIDVSYPIDIIKLHYRLLNELIGKEDIYDAYSSDYYLLSVRCLLNEYPELFNDPKIYDNIMTNLNLNADYQILENENLKGFFKAKGMRKKIELKYKR